MDRTEEFIRDIVTQVSRKYTDEGKLIEAGWQAMRLLAIPQNASPAQIDDMRKAFFCGATHLFASLMKILEPGEEATDKDTNRLELIDQELRAFKMEASSIFKPGTG